MGVGTLDRPLERPAVVGWKDGVGQEPCQVEDRLVEDLEDVASQAA